ncbi:MAG: murein biosynthesis integral membrane protein MurJ [Chlamydiales bacterium]|nr:murein biosynthesis integral membrane protein MurJ [Chlamydiales bacterium]NCF70108.1 murein biosynthesis integral membrane protein MurJ [Chlamydiales bacterium]
MAEPSLINQVLYSTRFLSLATLISRFTGVARDLATAALFGATPLLGAFMVAFRLSNLFRRLLGEGALNNAFMPIYKKLYGQSEESAKQFYYLLRSLMLLLLLLIVALVEVPLYIFIDYFPPNSKLIAEYTLIMFPALILICFYSLCSAYLNSQRKFFLSGIGPACFNLIWIASACLAYKLPEGEAMRTLAIGVVVAYLFEWLICDLSFYRKFYVSQLLKKLKLFLPEMKRFLAYLSLTAVGVGAAQLNSALDAIFARYASLEGPCYLWYAIRVQQLPLALIGIALATVSFSTMTEKGLKFEQLFKLLSDSFQKKVAYLIPISVLMFILGVSGLNLLYGRGAFSSEDVWETYFCFCAYSLGLLPMSLTLLLANFFYSQHDYKTPSISSVVSVVCNVILNTIFIFYLEMGAVSVALSTSISSLFNCAFLYWHIYKLTGRSLFPWRYGLKLIILGIWVAGSMYLFWKYTTSGLFSELLLPRVFSLQLNNFLSEFVVAVLAMSLGAYLLRCPDVFELFFLFSPWRGKK